MTVTKTNDTVSSRLAVFAFLATGVVFALVGFCIKAHDMHASECEAIVNSATQNPTQNK